jgi:ferredoxin-NADP reductase
MGSMEKKRVGYEVALKGKKKIAEGTYEFTFEKPKGFTFAAGKHVRVTLIDPPETDAEGNSRFLTLASTPAEPNLVFAMRMRDTAFKRVLGRMKPGEKVLVEMLLVDMHGAFAVHEDPSKPAVFLVGGIGIVPAYSMIKDALQRKLQQKLYLFYSNRRPEDAPYLAELEKLAKQNPSFTLVATMTEPEQSKLNWQGETGFIDKAMLGKYIDDLNRPIYYVAGLTEMVKAMQNVLAEAGVNKDSVRAEEFGAFSGAHAAPYDKWSRRTVISVIVTTLLALLLLGVHARGISHGDLTALSFENPLSYLVIALVTGILVFKIVALLKLKNILHDKRKNGENVSARDILKAHKPTRKD